VDVIAAVWHISGSCFRYGVCQNFPANFGKCTGNFRTHIQVLQYPSFETTGVGMQTI